VATATLSAANKPQAAELSPEVEWYLESRGYDLPDRAPLWRTPEPEDEPGALFDPTLVDKKIAALRCLRHTQGKWAGQPLEPNNVQVAYFIAPVFGWVRPDEDDGHYYRIINSVYIEMPRKGAKTTLVSGLAMVMAFADGEGGAQVLLGAASKDQAEKAYRPLEAVARASHTLREAGVIAKRHEITQDSTSSYIQAVSSRGDLAHGANVHCGLIDELHVHKDPGLLEAIESGTGARQQPIVFIITTADDGQVTSVYAQRRRMIEQLANGTLKDPSMYGVIFAAPKEADPGAEETWYNANPLYPVTPSRAFMKSAWAKAQANPAAMASFLRLHLGVRSSLDVAYFDLDAWDRNASIVDWDLLKDVPAAYGGLDLGSVSDLTALVWAIPDGTGGYSVVPRFFMPEAALRALNVRTANSATSWVSQGFLILTPGDVTDYDFVADQMRKDAAHLGNVVGIGYDRWNSSQMILDAEADGLPMVKVGQGYASLSAPLKELDRLTRVGTAEKPMLRHGGNPVLRWNADNLRPAMDPSGNLKPDKAKSMDKIDGISALTTAMAVALATEPEYETAYTDRGVEVV
jgi:phage terminase large subunit-like protein